MLRPGKYGDFPLDRSHISGAHRATASVASQHSRAVKVPTLKRGPLGIAYSPILRVGPLSTITPTHACERVSLAQRDRLAHLAPWLADNARLSLHHIYTTTGTKRDEHAAQTTTTRAPAFGERAVVVAAGTLVGSQTFWPSPLRGKFFSTWQKN